MDLDATETVPDQLLLSTPHISSHQAMHGGSKKLRAPSGSTPKRKTAPPAARDAKNGASSHIVKQRRRSRKKWMGFTMVHLGSQYAWFYPDPPCGRRDVWGAASKFLNIWNIAVWAANVYVAIAEPFLAAGFTTAYTNVRENKNPCNDHRRSPMDLLVDSVFLLDIVISCHTAYYRRKRNGQLVLIDDSTSIMRRYFHSTGFYWDMLGILPWRELFCLIQYLAPARIKPPKNLVGVLTILRMAKLARLHHYRHMWRFLQDRFPAKSHILAVTKVLTIALFGSHISHCAWHFITVKGLTLTSRGWLMVFVSGALYLSGLPFRKITPTNTMPAPNSPPHPAPTAPPHPEPPVPPFPSSTPR